MSSNNKLSLDEFKRLTESLIAIDVFTPSDDDLSLIAKAEKLGYVKDNEFTQAGYDALIECNKKTEPSASFVTQDGYKLHRNNEYHPCWTDNDLVFAIDEENGLPMDDVDETLEGLLTLRMPLELKVEDETFNLQAVVSKIVDWNEHHFPHWDLVIDETTEKALNQYTDKAFLTELLSTFAVHEDGLEGEIELGKHSITYQASYTLTTPDVAFNDLLDIAPDNPSAMKM